MPVLKEILDGHLDRNLDCGRAVVRIKHTRQRRTGQRCDQALRQLDGLWIRETENRSMRHVPQLLADSAIKGRVIVPMDISPNGRIAIEIAFAQAVLYPWTMTGDQYERLVIGRNPVAHLRKRMPHVRFVELDEVFGVVWHVRPVSCVYLTFSPLTPSRPSHQGTPYLSHQARSVINKTCIELD